MMLNPKRLFEKMCFKCTLERWHTTTTPDLFWQIVPQTRSQNTKSVVTIILSSQVVSLPFQSVIHPEDSSL